MPLLYYFQENAYFFIGFGLVYSTIINGYSGLVKAENLQLLMFPLFILNSSNCEPPIVTNITDMKSFVEFFANWFANVRRKTKEGQKMIEKSSLFQHKERWN
jgi:hypothetical protein